MSSFRSWHFDKKRLSAELQTTGWGKLFHQPEQKKENSGKERHLERAESRERRGRTHVLKWGRMWQPAIEQHTPTSRTSRPHTREMSSSPTTSVSPLLHQQITTET